MEIKFSCGFCGIPMDEDKQPIDNIPKGYDPDQYPHDVCESCYYENYESEERRRVTREMALDAGDPDLEGQLI